MPMSVTFQLSHLLAVDYTIAHDCTMKLLVGWPLLVCLVSSIVNDVARADEAEERMDCLVRCAMPLWVSDALCHVALGE